MSTSTLTPTPTSQSRSVRRAGAWCLGAALVGAAQAAIILIWPPQVSEDRFSYPFDGLGHGIAQSSFFLQHLPLIVGVAALLRLLPVRSSRTARTGIGAAVVGLVLLAVNELVTISAYDVALDSDHAALVQNLYGPPIMLIGIGLLVAGIALLRQGTEAWSGARWLPAVILALGVYVFVPMTPAIMGSFTAGRLGIGGWMLLFAVLGYGLTRMDKRDA
ncbi:MAG: hypothetical protein M4D85_05445 [Actinomycetota bacterium]|nr:hypothetical protein [Actinomycetota bacterium]